jgi:hypothetical protein
MRDDEIIADHTVNYSLIEALQRFAYYFGNSYIIECPTGSGQMKTLNEVAVELSRRLSSIFLRDCHGRRPVHGSQEVFQTDPHWKDLMLFYEYFHGDNRRGCGASHQTEWTALVAKLIQQSGELFAAAESPLSGMRAAQQRHGHTNSRGRVRQ